MSDNGGALPMLTKADFSSDQETRWCPGCGDYAILASVQGFLPELGIPPEKTVFVTGIGCAGRFVYYMDTYGMHGIHGRAPALATGVATSRPDLSVWVVSGDGDALSIGGNHLIHALRRNVPIKILLFNNQIYGLTKGQYSPTSEEGKVTKSTPFGSQDHPFNPIALALGAEATFVARTVDTDKEHVAATLRAAAAHRGAAFVEIYQNCNVFNDGAFDAVRVKGNRELNQIRLEHGKPIRFGGEDERGVVRGADGGLEIVDVADVDEAALRGARRAPARPRAGVRARPPRRAPHRSHARRRLPRRRAPGLRRGVRPRAGGEPRPGRHRRAARAAAWRAGTWTVSPEAARVRPACAERRALSPAGLEPAGSSSATSSEAPAPVPRRSRWPVSLPIRRWAATLSPSSVAVKRRTSWRIGLLRQQVREDRAETLALEVSPPRRSRPRRRRARRCQRTQRPTATITPGWSTLLGHQRHVVVPVDLRQVAQLGGGEVLLGGEEALVDGGVGEPVQPRLELGLVVRRRSAGPGPGFRCRG